MADAGLFSGSAAFLVSTAAAVLLSSTGLLPSFAFINDG